MNSLLQTWKKVGLNYVFFTDENRVQEMRAVSQENRPAQSKNSQEFNKNQENGKIAYPHQESRGNPNIPNTSNTPDIPIQKNQNKESTQEYTLKQEKARPNPSHAVQAPRTPSIKTFMNRETLSFSTWPNSWIAIKDRCNLPTDSSKARVAWTYEGLEEDLMGVANSARQGLIRRLLQDLNHSVGRHYFWPYQLPSALEQTDHKEKLFWSGLALMHPRVLLVFGSGARDAVGLPKDFIPFVQQEIAGMQILQMHKPETLEQDEKLYKETLVFLEMYLGFCKKNL